jgi:hypothetical protein
MYRPVFFLSVSLGYVDAVAAGDARLGTGIVNGGRLMLMRCPAVDPPGIATDATHAVFDALIEAWEAAVLRKASTVLVVVEASVIITDIESTIAPSLLLQSTSSTHPLPEGVLKFVAVVNPAVPPTEANE